MLQLLKILLKSFLNQLLFFNSSLDIYLLSISIVYSRRFLILQFVQDFSDLGLLFKISVKWYRTSWVIDISCRNIVPAQLKADLLMHSFNSLAFFSIF